MEPKLDPPPKSKPWKLKYTTWTRLEDQMLQEFVNHYGENFSTIAFELNFTFQCNRFQPGLCRQRWKLKNNTSIRMAPFTQKDVDTLYPLFLKSVMNGDYQMWERLSQSLVGRTNTRVGIKYIDFMKSVLKRLCYMYASDEMSRYYASRFHMLKPMTLYIMAYMTLMPPGQELLNVREPAFGKIVNSARSLYALVHVFFKERLVLDYDVQHYFQPEIMKYLPAYGEDDFEDLAEPILLLDTLTRIGLSLPPYDNPRNFIKEVKGEQRKVQQSGFGQIGKRYFEKAKYRKQYRTQSNCQLEVDLSILFIKLTVREQILIQNSEIVQNLLSYWTYFRKLRY